MPPGRSTGPGRSRRARRVSCLLAGVSLGVAVLVGGLPAAAFPQALQAPEVGAAVAAVALPSHTELEATFPAADSLYRGDVSEVRLRYTTAVQLALSTVRVRGPDGQALAATGPDTVPGTGSAEIRVRFDAPLPSGAYTVEWSTAGPDDHLIRGEYGFRVQRPEPEPAPDTAAGADTAGAPDSVGAPGAGGQEPSAGVGGEVPMAPTGVGEGGAVGPRPLGVAVRWLFFASIVGMLGAGVFRFTVLPVLARERGWEEAARVGRQRLLWLAGGAAVLGGVALPARIGERAATFFGAEGFTTAALGAILGTGWGVAWLVEAAALGLFVGGLALVRRRPRGGWLLMLGGGAVATVVPALAGHSRAVDPALRSLATVVDALHVAAASVWMGGLAALVLVGVGAAGRATGEDAGRALPRVVSAFSRVALVAVAGLVATGVVNAWLHLGSFAALWESGYGRTLALKLALVGVAAALGFYNWRVVRPTLRTTPRPALIRVPASVELAVGLAVLLVTAVLVATPLPGG